MIEEAFRWQFDGISEKFTKEQQGQVQGPPKNRSASHILTPRIRDSSYSYYSYSSSVTEKRGLTHYPTANTLSNG